MARDRLFYDRWPYCVKFYLCEVSALRDSLEAVDIITTMQRRYAWREQVRQRWPAINTVAVTGEINQNDVQQLLNFSEFLRQRATVDYKMVISVSYAWIYASDVAFIQDLVNLPYLAHFKLTQAQITLPRDCIAVRSPKHAYRSYLRSRKFTQQEKHYLENYLANQTCVQPSSSLQQWLDSHFLRSQDYYFVDHDGQGFETMLSLIVPNLIRRTLPIVAK